MITSPRRGRRAATVTATAVALVGSALVLTPSPASGADGDVTASRAVARTCAGRPRSRAPTARSRSRCAPPPPACCAPGSTAPATGTSRCSTAPSSKLVAASAGFQGTEVAAGFVTKGQDLLVQACRLPGAGATANLGTVLEPISGTSSGTLSVVEVDTKDRAAKQKLQGLGLDLTEHGTATTVEVVLHGAGRRAEAHGRRLHLPHRDRRPGGQGEEEPRRRRARTPTRRPARRCRAAARPTAASPTTRAR